MSIDKQQIVDYLQQLQTLSRNDCSPSMARENLLPINGNVTKVVVDKVWC